MGWGEVLYNKKEIDGMVENGLEWKREQETI